MFGPLSALLQCLRNGKPAQTPEPAQPDHQATPLDSQPELLPDCRIFRSANERQEMAASTKLRYCATVGSCGKGPTRGASPKCGFFLSGGGWQADGNWQPHRRRVVRRMDPGNPAGRLGRNARRNDPNTDRKQPALARARGKDA